jgi:phosphatidylserine/phosphatidylglycerophosphate/cardiolipin synthase-like enzyme
LSILTPETTWRIHEDAETALLIDGRDYYRAFYTAALRAKRSILLLGWQFDSDVQLLRGDDLPEGAAQKDVELLALLDRLCRERPKLQIRVLAWDYSVFFALERELLQKLYFDAICCERFVFRWDNTVPLGGSHHQKVAIIDGEIAFFGSQDICQARWDDSTHRPENEHRTSRGSCHRPYHEVQVALTGEPVRSLVELFVWRWYGATGEALDARVLVDEEEGRGEAARGLGFPVTLPMPPARVGLARTIPEVIGRAQVDEVSKLYVRAIAHAERLIYIESQYLTSCAVRDAFLARMRDRTRPKLDVVIILPHKPEKFKEEMTVGVPQAVLLQTLDRAAAEHGHALGIYNVVAGKDEDGQPVHVYIHAKLMIVDDRVLIVGSANLTNRSMTIDSEIIAAYEPRPGDRALKNAIRRARVRLMLEHAGEHANLRALVPRNGLVTRLDALIEAGRARLRRHEVREDEPGLLKKTVHELTLEFLDPWDGYYEGCPDVA